MDKKLTSFYNSNAEVLMKQYSSLSFEVVHKEVLPFIDNIQTVLDIGAGSGRDAAWFASRNAKVLAVEPSQKLRELAQSEHGSESIDWLDDCLPTLKKINKRKFDLIWLSAIWMHVDPKVRPTAFNKLTELLSPNGLIMVSLRHGESPPDRPMFPVSVAELESLCKKHSLKITYKSPDINSDELGRTLVNWETVLIQHA